MILLFHPLSKIWEWKAASTQVPGQGQAKREWNGREEKAKNTTAIDLLRWWVRVLLDEIKELGKD